MFESTSEPLNEAQLQVLHEALDAAINIILDVALIYMRDNRSVNLL